MSARTNLVLFLSVVLSTPAIFGVAWALKWQLGFGGALPQAPVLGMIAWGLVALAVASAAGAVKLQPAIYRAALQRTAESKTAEQRSAEARFSTMLLVTSIAQTPALVAAMLYLVGAELTPVVAAVAVSTFGVLAQWPGLQELGQGVERGRVEAA